jgi:hypothetical protein
MATLLDIAPVAKQVLIPTSDGEVAVDVRGLSIADIRDLLARFPDVLGMLEKGVTAAAIFKAGPDIVAAVIASACGNPGVKAVEELAASFGAGLQAEILTHVIKLTMPRGPGPFVELLKAAGVDLDKVSAAVSLPPSKPSSAKSTPSAKS